MKVRNKKTGVIVDLIEIVRIDGVSNEFYLRLSDNEGRTFKAGFNSLTELNEVWEDYKEAKEYYYHIYDLGNVSIDRVQSSTIVMHKNFGNYFETREEAEKAVEKLKAWKRLKDKGFRFMHNKVIGEYGNVSYRLNYPANAVEEKDLDLLFGGEE